jgi:hypothetical protein
MSKFSVAIIKPNEFNFNDSNTIIDVKNNISNYIKFAEVSNDEEMMSVVVNTLEMTENLLGDTFTCYENESYVYQICYLTNVNVSDNNCFLTNEKINNISSYLNHGKHAINGNCILIKTKISDDNLGINCTVTIDDISTILYKRIAHTCVHLSPNSEKEFIFSSDPFEVFQNTNIKNIKCLDIKYLNLTFSVYFELEPSINKINEKASLFINKGPVYGNVVIALKVFGEINGIEDGSEDFIDLDLKLFNKIFVVMNNKDFENKLTNNEHVDKKNNSKIIMNSHMIIEKRYNKCLDSYLQRTFILNENSKSFNSFIFNKLKEKDEKDNKTEKDKKDEKDNKTEKDKKDEKDTKTEKDEKDNKTNKDN